jgi:hypothetical protein
VGATLDIVLLVVIVGLFCGGGALVIGGMISKEPVSRLDLNPYTRGFNKSPEGLDPPDRRPTRQMLIGVGLMVLAVVLGFTLL